ncbi:hypothetical protein NIASO_14180 [Niabella soli DSM 19437]|uniref:Uncharacterized protein n=1 Tax=Niabella soli DSM 19437 TaxID=929713 RepID=W0F2E9_9BACT|nr:hypothetical protein NIASO_14180 [Niabella soli DSM 19437]
MNIPVDKKKTTRNFAASMLIVLLGLLFIIKPFWFIRSDDPAMIRTIGYLCIAFFGVISIFLTKTLLNKKEGLLLSEEGIIDQSSGIAAGKVLWKDIKSIRTELVAAQPFLMLEVTNPLEYIQNQINPLKKRAMELNYQLYKTPIGISGKFLHIEFEKLRELVLAGFENAKVK